MTPDDECGRDATATPDRIELVDGSACATIATRGAALAACAVDGVALVMPFDPASPRPAMRGAILAPWPNRIAGARYRFGGREHRLPVDEPATGSASHGLAADLPYVVVERSDRHVRMATVIEPRPGYPWRIELTIDHALRARRLHQRIRARNLSSTPAPVGLGSHPYLLAGAAAAGAIDDWRLRMPASVVGLAEPERPVPTVFVPVADAPALDFTRRRPLGATQLNHAYAVPLGAGRRLVHVARADGAGVELELGEGADWVQLYTADAAGESAPRHAIAVEPMTCAPNAFNSGRGLRAVAPGEALTLAWSLGRIAQHGVEGRGDRVPVER